VTPTGHLAVKHTIATIWYEVADIGWHTNLWYLGAVCQPSYQVPVGLVPHCCCAVFLLLAESFKLAAQSTITGTSSLFLRCFCYWSCGFIAAVVLVLVVGCHCCFCWCFCFLMTFFVLRLLLLVLVPLLAGTSTIVVAPYALVVVVLSLALLLFGAGAAAFWHWHCCFLALALSLLCHCVLALHHGCTSSS